jgi:hypothetical protein
MKMRESQNITIALLLVTAAVLGGLLFTGYMANDDAAYAAASVKGGDYIMGTAPKSDTLDFVYVVDISARQMILYEANINNWSIDMVARVDLDRVFQD